MVADVRATLTGLAVASSLDEALRLAALGLHVLPCCRSTWPDGPEAPAVCGCGRQHTGKEIGKAPLIRGGHLGATTDPAKIRRWLADWREPNLAIALWPSGLSAVDMDSDAAELDAHRRGLPATVSRQSARRAAVYRWPADWPIDRAIHLEPSGALDVLSGGALLVHGRHRTGAEIFLEGLERCEDFTPAPDWMREAVEQVARERAEQAERFEADLRPPGEPVDLDDDALARMMVQSASGEQIAKLLAGEWGDVPGKHYPSHSEADQALFNHLAWWTRRDAHRMRRMWAASGLYRPEKRDSYLRVTIQKAVAAAPPGFGEVDPRTPQLNLNGRRNGLVVRDDVNGSVAPAKRYPLTDMGNSERLVCRHGEDLRYCHVWGRWLGWTGRRWERDETDGTVRRMKDTVRAIYAEAAGAPTPEERKAVAAWAQKSEAEARINAAINLARSELPVRPAELDADQWALNVPNGTLDLRSGELRPHRREDRLTKLAGAAYDPDAQCPTWLAVLDKIMGGSAGLIRFLQRAIGYALTGDTREQVLFILYGTGQNGKSTLLETLAALLGDYAQTAEFSTFLARDRDTVRNDLADLFGARFVSAVEAEGGRRLAEALIKSLTGGDTIKARFLFQEYFRFRPTFKLFLAANQKPVIRGTDIGIWRRIRLIPFTVQIPEPEQDKALPEKLRAELAGILAWSLRGCLDWQRHGFDVPDEVKEATDGYRAEMDVLGDFLAERCALEPAGWATTRDLYKAYTAWCEASSERPLSKNPFSTRLAERGFASTRVGKAQARGWRGIRLLTDLEKQTQTQADTDSHKSYSSTPHVGTFRKQRPPVSVSADGRETNCWGCRAELSSDSQDACRACGWLVCPACGACSKEECSGEPVGEELPL